MVVNVLNVVFQVAKMFAFHQSYCHRQGSYSPCPPPSVLNIHTLGNPAYILGWILSLIISTLKLESKFFSQISLSAY
jgi:hypothetical protein